MGPWALAGMGMGIGIVGLSACTIVNGLVADPGGDAGASKADASESAVPDGGDAATEGGGLDGGGEDGGMRYVSTVLADNPYTYYRLEEQGGTVALDEMARESATFEGGLVLFGRPGALQSQASASVELRGGRLRASRVAFSFLGRAPFSLEAWVRPGLSTTASVFSREHETAAHEGYSLRITATEIRFARWLGGTENAAVCNITLVTGVFVHLVATYDGTAMALYMDGAPCASAASTAMLVDHPSDLAIGANSYFGSEALDGSLDEIAIYDKPLLATRVLAHYEARK